MELFDMKKHRFLFSASLMALVLLGCMAVVSCSNNFKHVPQTGFIAHQVKNKDSHIPFDAYWNADDKKIWNDRVNGVDGKKVMMAVVPVDTEHMDVRPDTAEGFDALRGLAEYFRKSVATRMEKEVAENPHFEMVPPGTRGAYTLELAIISITPTNARAGIFVTALSGIKGGGLVKRFIKKGHIAMAGRLRDESGRIVSEFADYEEDHSSLLGVDTKDFKKYAHHHRTIDEWAREITDVYSSAYGHWTQKRMISLMNLRGGGVAAVLSTGPGIFAERSARRETRCFSYSPYSAQELLVSHTRTRSSSTQARTGYSPGFSLAFSSACRATLKMTRAITSLVGSSRSKGMMRSPYAATKAAKLGSSVFTHREWSNCWRKSPIICLIALKSNTMSLASSVSARNTISTERVWPCGNLQLPGCLDRRCPLSSSMDLQIR